ncbi:MAG TPA: phosphate/phosphite/phosphonate ABC transporter substrate-binding protein [Anaerolineae bacterium]|nr:phosphate/phosphite/phosphonate ABC transporter substrate-binding protein [Anaerolineae bacterium]
MVLSACITSRSASPVIELNDLQPQPVSSDQNVTPLRVAVAAVISPQGTAESYTPLLDYLRRQLDRPVELVQRRTYAEINDLIRDGRVDLAFVCTRAYVIGHRDFGMELLAVPQVKGETVYYSYLIVPADSNVQDMKDLRGKVFAFTDPLSNTGYMYPLSLLSAMGESPMTFFSRTFFTYGHDNAIRAVADKLADGAAVDSLVYEFAVAREPALRERTRIIHRSQAFGMPPVVVGPNVRPQTKATLQEVLLKMDDNPAGRMALASLGIERFIPADDADYDGVRALERQVKPTLL